MKWIIGFFAFIGVVAVIQSKVPHWWTQGIVIKDFTIPFAWFCLGALIIALCSIKTKG